MADTLQFQNQFNPIVRALSRRQQLPVFKANERTIGNRMIEICISPHGHFVFYDKEPFTNYVYKRRGVGGQKNQLFINFYTIEM